MNFTEQNGKIDSKLLDTETETSEELQIYKV
jgi:hypothetical protein